jgi:hypothetical protein
LNQSATRITGSASTGKLTELAMKHFACASGASTGSDAYLDVVLVNYGYFGTTALAPYRPIVGMKFRLVRASDGKVLMLGHFGYSVMGSDTHPPEAYDYDHYDDFSSDQERSIKGIEDGLGKAAEAVGTALN